MYKDNFFFGRSQKTWNIIQIVENDVFYFQKNKIINKIQVNLELNETVFQKKGQKLNESNLWFF